MLAKKKFLTVFKDIISLISINFSAFANPNKKEKANKCISWYYAYNGVLPLTLAYMMPLGSRKKTVVFNRCSHIPYMNTTC